MSTFSNHKFNPAVTAALLAMSVTTLMGTTSCAGHQAEQQDRIIDNSFSRPDGSQRPDWIQNVPDQGNNTGRLYVVTSSTDQFDVETGIRISKAYALAQLSEQALVSVKTKSTLTTRQGLKNLNDNISWTSQAVFRSIRQDKSYWEKVQTPEGERYHTWVLWSIPEKAFYDAQQEALAQKPDPSSPVETSGN